MTYADDFRWRAIFLMHVYGISVGYVSYIFGPKVRTLLRWYSLFLSTGVVEKKQDRVKTSRWPLEVITRVKQYVKENPTFYLEELKAFLSDTFPNLENVSTSTICSALNFDMNLSRKVLTKAARECVPREVEVYKAKLQAIYSYPEQLLFIDETSKDGRHAYRRYAWPRRNRKAVVRLPFARGERRSILAALDHQGFVAWSSTPGTFTRNSFHRAFMTKIVPLLNPWPLPRSIVILDNAKIHLYKELEEVCFRAKLYEWYHSSYTNIYCCFWCLGNSSNRCTTAFLPPYSPHLNPIEVCFGLLKKWIQKHANLVFPLYPDRVLDVAMRSCCSQLSQKEDQAPGVLNLYAHCGYVNGSLRSEKFTVQTYEEGDGDEEDTN